MNRMHTKHIAYCKITCWSIIYSEDSMNQVRVVRHVVQLCITKTSYSKVEWSTQTKHDGNKEKIINIFFIEMYRLRNIERYIFIHKKRQKSLCVCVFLYHCYWQESTCVYHTVWKLLNRTMYCIIYIIYPQVHTICESSVIIFTLKSKTCTDYVCLLLVSSFTLSMCLLQKILWFSIHRHCDKRFHFSFNPARCSYC